MTVGALFRFPVRRRLALATLAWLAGIGMAGIWACPAAAGLPACALLALGGAACLARRRSALLCFSAAMLLAGNMAAGSQLAMRDEPTPPGTAFSGTVEAIESPFRVHLRDVRIDGRGPTARSVVVTLMREEDETREEVCVGQRVCGTGRLFAQEERRNPGGIDRRVRALCEGYELSGYLLPGWEAEGEAVFSPREAMRRLRERLLARLQATFGERAALFQGVMLGERGALDGEVMSAMRMTGIVHVLTVSGLHLSLIAAVLSRLLGRLPVGRGARLALEWAGLSFFAGLTGAAPGTIRALIMALMRSLAAWRGRQYEPLTALSVAALGMTAACPLLVFHASFQFSFFVVLGILLLGHAGMRRGGLLSGVKISAGAQIAALPMQLMLYGYVPLLSLPMNLLCGVLVPILMIGGWATMALGGVLPPLGNAAAKGLGALGGLLEEASVLAASAPHSLVRLPAPPASAVLLFAALMMLCSRRIRFGRARRHACGAIALLIAVAYAPCFCPQARYVQLDVGQGDGAVLRAGRKAVLVDVGPEGSYEALRYLRHEGLFVEEVILSHLDEDHAGALGTLLRSEVEIGAVAMPVGAMDGEVSEAVREALALASQRGIPIREEERGDRIETSVAAFDVLSPDEALSGSNERSLVLYADAWTMPLLLTGDLPADSEREDFPDCALLKVAHHGSKYATSAAFLEAVSPEIALISVGAGNSYGHPSERVLSDLRSAGARVLRTDEAGCITVWLESGYTDTFLPAR